VNMLYNRGRYLAAYGGHEEAIEAYKRSLELSPRFTLAQTALNESLSALRKAPSNTRP
jgi:tetratricopeptide (TPR) repeat protein